MMDAIEEFRKYFESGNGVPVSCAVIHAELANRLIKEFESMEERLDNYYYDGRDDWDWE